MASSFDIIPQHRFPAIREIVDAVLGQWPSHEAALARGLGQLDQTELSALESVAARVKVLIGPDLEGYAKSYIWMCETFFEEEVYFRRNKKYRYSTFAEANSAVYQNEDFMQNYMQGLLISQVLWVNHAQSTLYFNRNFLKAVDREFNYLEIGPGHGLSLAEAAAHPLCRSATGWDVSPTSLAHTRASLDQLGVGQDCDLAEMDILTVPDHSSGNSKVYDLAVISEVLEHVEDPVRALKALHRLIRVGGRLFVNMPINSPAPDHIYLLGKPDEVTDLVESAGFRIIEGANFPAAGHDLATAIARKFTVSCAVIAERVAQA